MSESEKKDIQQLMKEIKKAKKDGDDARAERIARELAERLGLYSYYE